MASLKWGLLAAGGIARAFAAGVKETDSGEAVAVASRSGEKAATFAKEFGIPKHHEGYDALLADPDVQAVYISTPHPMHAEWAIKAADAGKHILCEKPVTLNWADTTTVIEAARRNDVFFMEAFMYRCNPQTAKLAELVRDGAIGDVRVIDAVFAFQCGYNLESRLLNAALGGGGILDVGCYTVSMSRLIAGAALGRDFADPVAVQGMGRVGPESRVDEWAVGTLGFENDIVARIATGVQQGMNGVVTVYGSGGMIEVPSPWFCNGREPGQGRLRLHRHGKDMEEVVVDVPKGIYAIEADVVAANLEKRQAPSPAMSWADTLGNMRALDDWRQAVGVTYPAETVEGYAEPIDRRPLRVRAGVTPKTAAIPGVDKPISRLVMGTMSQRDIRDATALFDDFFARGGNCWDTAYIYGGGNTERLLGQWIRNRGVRDDVVLAAKGAHTPHCDPDGIERELLESLDRLQTDHVDLYMMHRDNLDIPVGEFVAVLNELKDAGQMRAFGASNWTLARVKEANAWAKKNDKTGFAAVSNNFSLARMVQPLWKECVASSTPEWRAWHEETQTPLLSWSSQGRGFFVPGRAAPDKTDDKHLVDSWYSDDNFERRRRCFELAEKRGVHPCAVAASYVLHQPFPVFCLIGPACIQETADSFAALDVALTPEEAKWLNLEA